MVLVGIADYPGTRSDLKVSSNDAVMMRQLYEKNGDAVVDMLIDGRATVASVKAAIVNLFSKATADNTVVFFSAVMAFQEALSATMVY